MTAYEPALFVHLVGVVLLAGGLAVASAAFERARRRERPEEIALLLGLTRTGVALVASGTLVVLVGGFWLIDAGEHDLGDGWLAASLALFLLATVLGIIGGNTPKRARERAEQLARDAAPSDAELRRLLDDRVARTLNYAAALMMVGVLALMVAKP